jgi:hypothetical protein
MNGRASKKRELAERGKKPTAYRRIVTGNANGKSVVQSDERMQAYQFKTVPGYEHTLISVSGATPDLSKEQRFDRYPDSVVPGPGGTGDVVVQNGTRHAWRNKGTKPVTMLFFLNGAKA